MTSACIFMDTLRNETTDDKTFYSEDEPRRVFWTSPLDESFQSEGKPRRVYLLSSPTPPSPSHKLKKKLEMGMFCPNRAGMSPHVCEACGQVIPQDIPGTSTKDQKNYTKSFFIQATKLIIQFHYI